MPSDTTLRSSPPFGPDLTVAVIGAGVSGICTAAHLIRHGVSVIVFERSGVAGGVWNYQESTWRSPTYPSERPSVGEYDNISATDIGLEDTKDSKQKARGFDERLRVDLELTFAPPGACYASLKTNVPTTLMYSTLKFWPEDIKLYVEHSDVKRYLEDLSEQFGVNNVTHYWTRVESARKAENGDGWCLRTITLDEDKSSKRIFEKEWNVDALVVASGHYNLPRVPNIPGLAEIKTRFPDRILHSKEYRSAGVYADKSVLVVGGGTSAVDICQEIHKSARSVTQSTRNGQFDLPTARVPQSVSRVSEVVQLKLNSDTTDSADLNPGQPLPADIILRDGRIPHGIDHIILATGYLFSFPFLRQFHSDETPAEAVGHDILVGSEGTMVHNLHKDIFYIEDPSLAFVGIPYHLVTFSTFDCQA